MASAVDIRDFNIARGGFRIHLLIGADILHGTFFKPEGIQGDGTILEDQHKIVQARDAGNIKGLGLVLTPRAGRLEFQRGHQFAGGGIQTYVDDLRITVVIGAIDGDLRTSIKAKVHILIQNPVAAGDSA